MCVCVQRYSHTSVSKTNKATHSFVCPRYVIIFMPKVALLGINTVTGGSVFKNTFPFSCCGLFNTWPREIEVHACIFMHRFPFEFCDGPASGVGDELYVRQSDHARGCRRELKKIIYI